MLSIQDAVGGVYEPVLTEDQGTPITTPHVGFAIATRADTAIRTIVIHAADCLAVGGGTEDGLNKSIAITTPQPLLIQA